MTAFKNVFGIAGLEFGPNNSYIYMDDENSGRDIRFSIDGKNWATMHVPWSAFPTEILADHGYPNIDGFNMDWFEFYYAGHWDVYINRSELFDSNGEPKVHDFYWQIEGLNVSFLSNNYGSSYVYINTGDDIKSHYIRTVKDHYDVLIALGYDGSQITADVRDPETNEFTTITDPSEFPNAALSIQGNKEAFKIGPFGTILTEQALDFLIDIRHNTKAGQTRLHADEINEAYGGWNDTHEFVLIKRIGDDNWYIQSKKGNTTTDHDTADGDSYWEMIDIVERTSL